MGEEVVISVFHQVGLRGVDVQLDDWDEDAEPTQGMRYALLLG